ncbi:MAG: phosphoribosylformylglycinamidine synthase II, partial [Thalassobaculaceae bacterium]
ALAGGLGANLEAPATGAAAWAFGEDQARYVVTAPDAAAILAAAAAAEVPAAVIGHTQAAPRLNLGSNRAISMEELGQRHEGWLPRYMGGEING